MLLRQTSFSTTASPLGPRWKTVWECERARASADGDRKIGFSMRREGAGPDRLRLGWVISASIVTCVPHPRLGFLSNTVVLRISLQTYEADFIVNSP